ncbi:MAG TPA: CaiB/BaiF CoA-transferase family protein [Burkholderiales bacterium]
MAATQEPVPGRMSATAEGRPRALPLAGVRVVEFVHMIMGPSCGLVLADLGAEVIKIEPLAGDNTRRLTGTGAGFWATYNRNKKSLALDLKSPAGIEIANKLLATADAVTENFRPGTMDKLGLSYEDVKKLRPEIIYCSLKGFLPGPYEQRTALDEVVQMMGGLAYMTGPEGRPLRAGASVNDIMGGMFGAIAILAALHEKKTTGRGQFVQSALFENNVFLVAQHMMQYAVTGKPAAPMPSRLSAWAVYDVFDTADGGQLFVGVVSDTQWKAFCEHFGMTELAADASLATNNQRVHARERMLPPVRARFARMSKAELMDACERAGLPYAPIVKPQELFDDPHLNASGGFAEVTLADGRRVKTPKLPFEMDGRRFGAELDVPALGSHTRDLLAGLGYSADATDRLIQEGVIGSAADAPD